MVDATEARKVARQAIANARAFYGIDPAWEVTLEIQSLKPGDTGWINILPDYRRASITIDPGQCSTATDVRKTAAHEVAHLLLADFEVFRSLVVAHLGGEDLPPVLAQAYKTADERTTVMLEQLFMRERPAARRPRKDRP